MKEIPSWKPPITPSSLAMQNTDIFLFEIILPPPIQDEDCLLAHTIYVPIAVLCCLLWTKVETEASCELVKARAMRGAGERDEDD